ncbi:MAG TPA: diguanylate cyclase, partial [Candidatus Edwardsbacteria bacterium]|nr:diguanylate cyclase [Candidatus Edwardsbacteria bacterium]
MANNHDIPQLPQDCYKSLLDQTYDGVNFVDTKRRILYWNKGAEAITGYAMAEIAGRHCYDGIMCHIDDHGVKLCEQLCPLLAAIDVKQRTHKRVYLRTKSGQRIPVDAVSSPVYDEDHQLLGAVQIFRDASAYEQAEKESQVIAKLAATDPLTGLLNRRQLEVEVELEVNRARRLQLPISVLYGDLDHFKRVNDEHGHACGDQLLQDTARALQSGVRPYDRISRFGGDEFVLLLPETQLQLGVEIAERLRRAVEGIGLACEGRSVGRRPSISFGLAELRDGEA